MRILNVGDGESRCLLGVSRRDELGHTYRLYTGASIASCKHRAVA